MKRKYSEMSEFEYQLRGGDQMTQTTHWDAQRFVPLMERDNVLWGIVSAPFLALLLLFVILPLELLYHLVARPITKLYQWLGLDE